MRIQLLHRPHLSNKGRRFRSRGEIDRSGSRRRIAFEELSQTLSDRGVGGVTAPFRGSQIHSAAVSFRVWSHRRRCIAHPNAFARTSLRRLVTGHFAHFESQGVRDARFRRKRHAFAHHALMDDGIPGAGRGEGSGQCRRARAPPLNRRGSLPGESLKRFPCIPKWFGQARHRLDHPPSAGCGAGSPSSIPFFPRRTPLSF
jgi:hypothetical protein